MLAHTLYRDVGQVHTFDHTLPSATQILVASTPGVNFHPIGIGSPSKGTGVAMMEAHFLQVLKSCQS